MPDTRRGRKSAAQGRPPLRGIAHVERADDGLERSILRVGARGLETEQAAGDLGRWLSWARRCRLDPFKKLAATIKDKFDAVVRGMLDHRSNAFVESMNGQLQQAKRAARGYRTSKNFIAIAYLRLSRLKHLPAHPFAAAAAN